MESKKNYRTDNKSFMLYKEWETLFSLLSEEEAGLLIKSLFAFASRGEIPQTDNTNSALQMAFFVMSQQIQRDGEKWERSCETRAENIKKRWAKNASDGSGDTNVYNCIQMNTNVPDKEKEEETDKDKDKDKDKEEVKEEEKESERDAQKNTHASKEGFIPPSVSEVTDYCYERCNGIDAQYFVDFYTANGWTVGQSPMKDWKATVRRWEKNGIRPPAHGKNAPYPAARPQNSSINMAEVDALFGWSNDS